MVLRESIIGVPVVALISLKTILGEALQYSSVLIDLIALFVSTAQFPRRRHARVDGCCAKRRFDLGTAID
jgi:hypothetical protein